MLGFLGGTGPEGKGLAFRLALAGHEVLIGSRDVARAQEAADEVAPFVAKGQVRGVHNMQVAQEAEIVFITVPFTAQRQVLDTVRAPLASKIVVSTVVPVDFTQGQRHSPILPLAVEEGCAALQAQTLLPDARVVGAFQNVSAVDLRTPGKSIEGDVIVCADDPDAKEAVMRLAEQIPSIHAVDGGPLQNAHYVEELTFLLLNINRIYKGSRSMIKIVGLREEAKQGI